VKAYPNYWGTKPQYQTVKFLADPEASTRVAALQAGEVDIAFDVPSENISSVPAVKSVPQQSVNLFRLNAIDGISKDPKVREALAMGTDTEGLRKALYGDSDSQPATCQFSQAGIAGHNDSLKAIPYNPTKAKQLLQQAGVIGRQVVIVAEAGSIPKTSEFLQAVASEWDQLGLKVKLEIDAQSGFVAGVGATGPKSPEVLFLSIDSSLGTALQPMQTMINSGPVGRFPTTQIPQVPRLLTQAGSDLNSATREQKLDQLDTQICNSHEIIFLNFTDEIWGTQKGITWPVRRDATLIPATVTSD